MRIISILIITSLILFFHEGGHYCAAKLLGLQIDKISFSWRPYPRVYVSVLEKGITDLKRIVYLLSGNLVTTCLFIFFNFVAHQDLHIILFVLAIQIIVETNPFLSDYASIVFWLANKRDLKKIPSYIYHHEQEEDIQKFLAKLQESYFLSRAWIFHFLVWTVLLVVLLKFYVKAY